MFSNKSFVKIASLFTLISFSTTIVPVSAKAQRLTPLSFSEMYWLAENGDIEALRASVRRGMNIDTVNANGDTGLCIAAKQRDSYTYNAFRASGANPRHPCTQHIRNYADFVNSTKTVSVTATPREAYGAMGKEEYKISAGTWWLLGGLAVAGGVAAAVAGGGGGGGGGGSDSNSTQPENLDSLGNNLSQNGSVMYRTQTFPEKINNIDFDVIKNNNPQISTLNLNKEILEASKIMNAGLLAENGGKYINEPNHTIGVSAGTVGMASISKDSISDNQGYINVESYNASIAMAASNQSTAINNGQGVVNGSDLNGIDLYFSGTKESDTIIGMYADNKSSIINDGDIRGTATKQDSSVGGGNTGTGNEGEEPTEQSAGKGTIIGMETMIINTGENIKNTTITAENNGNIELSGGAGLADTEVKISLIGMGGFLEDGFLNGKKNIRLAERAFLENNGTITLGYTGNYTTESDKTLRLGTGGVVGIRADANTYGLNNGVIEINLTNESLSGETGGSGDESPLANAVSAGMQSVHGANITNASGALIRINTSSPNKRVNYGMIAVEGSGTISGLYTNTLQVLQNSGNIVIADSNSYGMATYNAGSLINTGNITLGSDSDTSFTNNVAMYASDNNLQATITNKGVIDIYSHASTAIKNDFSGDTTIYNDGVINVHKSASDSKVFAGKYSNIINNGVINYSANTKNTETKSGSGSSASGGNEATDPSETMPNYFSFDDLVANVMTTKSDSTDTSSNTESVQNGGGTINVNSTNVSAMTVDTKQGSALNTGIINLNDSDIDNYNGNVGMLLGAGTIKDSRIENKGYINVNTSYSVGMGSQSTTTSAVINDRAGIIYVNGDKSYAMYAVGNSYLHNDGLIVLNGDNTVAFYTESTAENQDVAKIRNNRIKVNGVNATIFQIKGKAEVDSIGYIEIANYQDVIDSLVYFDVEDSLTFDKEYAIEGGTFIKMRKDSNVIIDENAELYLQKNGVIVDNSLGGTLTNKGTLESIGLSDAIIVKAGNGKAENVVVNNEGTIRLSKALISLTPQVGNVGVLVNKANVSNKGLIEVVTNSSYGIKSVDGTTNTITNETEGEISVWGDNSYGIYVGDSLNTTDKTTITHKGAIKIYGTSNVGIYGGKNTTITSEGSFYSGGSNSYSIYAGDNSTVTNKGDITSQGYGSVGIYGGNATKITNDGTVTNNNEYSMGIYGGIGSSITNNGEINLANKSSTGITGGIGSTIKNYSTITAEKSDSVGISVTSGTIDISNDIYMYGGNSIGLTSEDDSTINVNGKSLISVTGSGSAGIYGEGKTKITTSADSIIRVDEVSGGYGIYGGNGSNIENNADIYLSTNSGSGTFFASSAIRVVNGPVTNNGLIEIDVYSSYGIYGDQSSTLTNYSDIKVLSSKSIALYGTNLTQTASISNTATGTITIDGSYSKGIYADNGSVTNAGNIIFASNSSNSVAIESMNTDVTNNGKIDIYGTSNKGISVSGGSFNSNKDGAINIYAASTGIHLSDIKKASSNGAEIYIDSNASSSTGIYLENVDSFTNSGQMFINGDHSFGINATATQLTNNGRIVLGQNANDSTGILLTKGYLNSSDDIVIYGDGQKGINLSGAVQADVKSPLSVYGNDSYGVYVEGGAILKYSGKIDDVIVRGANSYGLYVTGEGSIIYVESEDMIDSSCSKDKGGVCEVKKTTEGTGTGTPDTDKPEGGSDNQEGGSDNPEGGSDNPVTPASYSIFVADGGTIKNNTTLSASGDIDFNKMNDGSGFIEINKKGQYKALSFKGNVVAGADITQSGFDSVYRKQNAFVGQDSGLQILSGSYMFNASKEVNNSGNIDVVMTMKSFEDLALSRQLKDYFADNYENQRGEKTFNLLKGMQNEQAFSSAVTKELGFDTLPNMAKQDLDLLANVNREANDNILAQTNEAERVKVDIIRYENDIDGKGEVSGYEDKVIAGYGFSDVKIANKWRAGYGVAVARSDVDFDNGSSRYNNVVEIFAPLSYVNDNFRTVIKPKVGFGHGSYRREGAETVYKSDMTNYYYGVDTEARHTADLGLAKVEPAVGLNVTGVSMDKIKENNGGIKTNGDDLISAVAFAGLDIKKEFELGKKQSVELSAGGRYYHEFGEKYRTTATIGDMIGGYEIKSNRLQRDYGLIKVKAGYNYGDFSLGATMNAPLEQQNNVYWLFDLGYKF